MQAKILIVLTALAAGVIYSACAYFGRGYFGAPMVAPFISMSIALNASMVFRRVRVWLFKRFYGRVAERAMTCNRKIVGDVAREQELGVIVQIVMLIFNHLNRRLSVLTTIGVCSCSMMAAVGGTLFWVGVPEDGQSKNFLFLLLLPTVMFVAATVVCCLCSLDVCNEIFEVYEDSVKSEKLPEGASDLRLRVKFDNALAKFERL